MSHHEIEFGYRSIQDNIATPKDLELGSNTGRAVALIGSKPPAGAPIVDKVSIMRFLKYLLFTGLNYSLWKQEP